MKLSIFTTATNPLQRGDTYLEALDCYSDLADEVIVVDGINPPAAELKLNPVHKIVGSEWPKEFDWPFIGQQFQRGYEACTGDWVIHADLDFIFHEKDFGKIREALELYSKAPAVSFYKWQFILPDRYNLKSRLPLAVNKRVFGDRIKFDGGGDLCQPTLDGNSLDLNEIPQSQIPVYNYEKLIKTREQIMDDVGRMERAYKRHFGHTQYGSSGEDIDAYKQWIKAQAGKMNKPQEKIALDKHPKYIQETIKNLTPDQFGYDGHGYLERNSYVSCSCR